VSTEGATDDEMAECHSNCTPDQQSPAADLVDEEEHDGCEDDEEGVLDT